MQQGRVPSKQLACSATALYLLVATLAAWCVLSIDSWPWNHDYVSTFQRVEVFRLAYLAGDFFPIWTPFGQNGYGSPFPFFYHRLYNSVVGLIALVCSTVTAVRISIPLMLLIGGLGMFRLAKRVGISTPLACLLYTSPSPRDPL